MDWTISRRIWAGFVGALTLVMVAAGGGVIAHSRISASYAAALASWTEQLAPDIDAQRLLAESWIQHLQFVMGDPSSPRGSRDSILALLREDLSRLEAAGQTDDARLQWNTDRRAIEAFEVAMDSAAQAYRSGSPGLGATIQREQAIPARLRADSLLDRAAAQARAVADADLTAAKAESVRSGRILRTTGVLLLLFGSLGAWLMVRSVVGPLGRASDVLASAAGNISSAVAEQAAGAAESASAVAETVASVDELSHSATDASDRARAVAESARANSSTVDAGLRAVEDSITASDAVTDQVGEMADRITDLAEQAQAIGTIIASVSEIAERTNLLALNAAVEAARAGDQGRGFAVVAAEVRALAEESKEATVDVRRILGDVQKATASAVMATEQGTRAVELSSQRSADAGVNIRILATAIREAEDNSAQIRVASEQQALALSQIRQSMNAVNQALSDSLIGIERTEAATRELATMGDGLVALIGVGRGG